MMTQWAREQFVKAYQGKRKPITHTSAVHKRTGEHLEHHFFSRGKDAFVQVNVVEYEQGDVVEVYSDDNLMFVLKLDRDPASEPEAGKEHTTMFNFEFAHTNAAGELELEEDHVAPIEEEWDDPNAKD